MTAPSADGPPTTPDAFDPLGPLRDLYGDVDRLLLLALSQAVADTISHPESRALVEARLQRRCRQVVATLNARVPNLIDLILDDAGAEGVARGQE